MAVMTATLPLRDCGQYRAQLRNGLRPRAVTGKQQVTINGRAVAFWSLTVEPRQALPPGKHYAQGTGAP